MPVSAMSRDITSDPDYTLDCEEPATPTRTTASEWAMRADYVVPRAHVTRNPTDDPRFGPDAPRCAADRLRTR